MGQVDDTSASRVSPEEAIEFARDLRSLQRRLKRFDPNELTAALKTLSDAGGGAGLGPSMIGAMATSARAVADFLVLFEYQLKRVKWTRPVVANDGAADGLSPALPEPEQAGARLEGRKEVEGAVGKAGVSVAHLQEELKHELRDELEVGLAPETGLTSRGPTGLSAGGPFPSSAEEEVWVMDQLDLILKHSRSAVSPRAQI